MGRALRFSNKYPSIRISVLAITAITACFLACGTVMRMTRSSAEPERGRSRDYLIDGGSIRSPRTFPASMVKLSDSDEVIGVSQGGCHRAYLLAALRPRAVALSSQLEAELSRHVVNDRIAGVPITVTYCDIADCVRAFTDPRAAGPLEISVGGISQTSGGSLVLMAKGSRYYQSSGRNYEDSSATFPYVSKEFVRTTWKQWHTAHPDTDVYVGTGAQFLKGEAIGQPNTQ